MIKQKVIRTSLIFAISATMFSHYSYAETSSDIKGEGVNQKLNSHVNYDNQYLKNKQSSENINTKEFNHTSDETNSKEEPTTEETNESSDETNSKEEPTTEETHETSDETNSKEEPTTEETNETSDETNSKEKPTTEETHETSDETNSKEEPKTKETHETSNETNSKEEPTTEETNETSDETNTKEEPTTEETNESSDETNSKEEPATEKVKNKNQQKNELENINNKNASSSKVKNNDNKYKTSQNNKNYQNKHSTIFNQGKRQNEAFKSTQSKQNQMIHSSKENTSPNIYSKNAYQIDKTQNNVSKTMINRLFSRQQFEKKQNTPYLKQNQLYLQDNRTKEYAYQRESGFSENILNRFNHYAKGAYKYNPYIINKVNHLDDNGEKITNKDFNRLIKKQKFDNQNLNTLQKNSQYFRFQYFNPLNAKEYYKNLDEQVLSLITGEIGSMPDLKKPKRNNNEEIEEGQHKKVITSSSKKTKAKSYLKKLNMILIPTLFLIFSTIIIIYIYHLKMKKN